jgi:hypothetical protein
VKEVTSKQVRLYAERRRCFAVRCVVVMPIPNDTSPSTFITIFLLTTCDLQSDPFHDCVSAPQ